MEDDLENRSALGRKKHKKYFLHVLVKEKVKKKTVRLMKKISREEYISPPSFRSFSEDGGLNSPT